MLRRIESQGAYASLALAGELERGKVEESERRLATELVYGVLRHDRRIDRAIEPLAPRGLGKLSKAALTALRVGAYQILFLDRVPAHAAVNDAASAARKVGGPRLAGFVNRVLRELASRGEPALPARDDPRFAEIACSLPGWIAAELRAEVGPEALATAAEALTSPAPLWIRINSLRAGRDEVAAALIAERPRATAEPSAIAEHALAVTGFGSPETSDSFQRGLWTVQDLGAQLVTRLVAPARGELVLDACAGVGGKTTYLAELAGGEIDVDAADVAERKLDRLADGVRRLGTPRVRPVRADLTSDATGLRPHYDAILLDAPCTGLGVLRRHPEAKHRVTEGDVAQMAQLQGRLLDALAPRVRPGGRLVYAVCTFTAAEGRRQMAAFVERNPAFFAEETLRTWPHEQGADAFFAARLVRRG